MLLMSSADFFQKIISGTLSDSIVQIWVQTVCKGYEQITKVATSKVRVNPLASDGFSNADL